MRRVSALSRYRILHDHDASVGRGRPHRLRNLRRLGVCHLSAVGAGAACRGVAALHGADDRIGNDVRAHRRLRRGVDRWAPTARARSGHGCRSGDGCNPLAHVDAEARRDLDSAGRLGAHGAQCSDGRTVARSTASDRMSHRSRIGVVIPLHESATRSRDWIAPFSGTTSHPSKRWSASGRRVILRSGGGGTWNDRPSGPRCHATPHRHLPGLEVWRSGQLGDETTAFPEIASADGIWPFVRAERVEVNADNDTFTTEIACMTTWDEEHTLGVRLHGDRVVELCGSIQ